MCKRGGDVPNVNIDWEQIKAEYLMGGTSYRKLAEKYGITFTVLSRRAKREQWRVLLVNARDKAETKVIQKIADKRAERIELQEDTCDLLTRRLHDTVKSLPDFRGSRMERMVSEYTPVTVDENSKAHPLKRNTVIVESNLLEMAKLLKGLMDMTGFVPAGGNTDDGFIAAIDAGIKGVTADDCDTPEDLDVPEDPDDGK
jgi:transposase-like protein